MNKTTIIKSIAFKVLLCLPLVFLTFCDTQEELVFDGSKNLITKNSKVVELLTEMATKNLEYGSNLKSSSTTPECTGLKYPVTFDAYYGDNPAAQQITINSDQELLDFFNTQMTAENPYYILFPVTLIDVEGIETEISSLEELEGTIQMALDACYGDNDSDDDGSDDDSDNGSDDGDDNDDSDDGSDDGGYNDENDDDSAEYKYCEKNNKKVYICHKGITICVSVNAIWGHLNQHEEDFLGTCD